MFQISRTKHNKMKAGPMQTGSIYKRQQTRGQKTLSTGCRSSENNYSLKTNLVLVKGNVKRKLIWTSIMFGDKIQPSGTRFLTHKTKAIQGDLTTGNMINSDTEWMIQNHTKAWSYDQCFVQFFLQVVHGPALNFPKNFNILVLSVAAIANHFPLPSTHCYTSSCSWVCLL